jgi:hypothetical protein
MEAISSSERSINTQWTTRCYIPEAGTLQHITGLCRWSSLTTLFLICTANRHNKQIRYLSLPSACVSNCSLHSRSLLMSIWATDAFAGISASASWHTDSSCCHISEIWLFRASSCSWQSLYQVWTHPYNMPQPIYLHFHITYTAANRQL